MELGVQLYSLQKQIKSLGADKVLADIAAAGFDGVEFAGFYDLSPDEWLALLSKHGLVARSAHINYKEIEGALPYIAALGIKWVIVPYASPEQLKPGAEHDGFVKELNRLQKLLSEHGVVLGYHNHAHEFEGGNRYMDSLVAEVSGLKVEPDVFWITVAGLDAVSELNRHAGRIVAVHIKEAAAVDPQNSAQPIVGEGAIDMPAVFDTARSLGVDWAVLEVEKFDGDYRDYLAASFKNMKKFGK